MAFADRFSTVAPGYARFRPGYPDELFRRLAGLAPRRERVWDCGSGSGQAASGLRRHFRFVVATDASRAQLGEALRTPGIVRMACTGERAALADASVDLVTVAQALHWMDADAFYREARRVARPDGIVAVWSYDLCRIDDGVDPVLSHLYRDRLAAWWSPERRHVEAGYATLPFPFQPLDAGPSLMMVRDLTRRDLLGYVETWSAVSAARRAGEDPVPDFTRALERVWSDGSSARTARWPVALRVGRAQ